ncbi:unnamed protein product [Linum tenue]|uniref:Uncharacterized protein n=1 Tax=Linum tenue TaxID=586396 RepID=A0AAV0NNX8_9ROSI|nr:unnamed protein product [Linum tenue]CAI0460092.1 unnamed protein product [Linum tenue]
MSVQEVGDELVVAGIVYCYISFGQLPNGVFEAALLVICWRWSVHFVDGSELISIGMWQAQFDCQRLQCIVALQNPACSSAGTHEED